MNYIAVRGSGDPNQEDGEYKQAIGLLYGIAFTIKMSKKGDHQIDGYFDYVVPREEELGQCSRNVKGQKSWGNAPEIEKRQMIGSEESMRRLSAAFHFLRNTGT